MTSTNPDRVKIYVGNLVDCPKLGDLRVRENGVLMVCAVTGKILTLTSLDPNSTIDEFLKQHQSPSQVESIQVLTDDQFLVPGLIDTHIHAPQYVFTGTGYDLPLLEWLKRYTFPREAAFAQLDHARTVYDRVVAQTLKCGTTTACYYGTIHLEASCCLAETVLRHGQRAFVGKINMDRNSPEDYVESTRESLTATRDFVSHVQGLKDPRVTPCITPRFVPTCSSELMEGLATIAQEHKLPIQSHCSENVDEVEWVASLHPECPSYASTYHAHGLLTDRSIMAHCIYLKDSEIELFHTTQAAVSHCPNSNFSLQSGVLNVHALLSRGIKVGLGTDVAGGYSFSMMDAMRQCIIASKVTYLQQKKDVAQSIAAPFGFKVALFLATMGGAECMGLQESIGSFEVGKAFDALLVDLAPPSGNHLNIEHPHTHLSMEERVERWVYLGDDRNLRQVWVQGHPIAVKVNHS